MNQTTTSTFDQWAIVEIMGHQRFAGRVTEQTIGGQSFIRVQVPKVDDDTPAFEKLFGAGSIYCITPVEESVARMTVQGLRRSPIQIYDLPEEVRRRISQPVITSDGDSDNGVSDYDDDGVF